MSGDGRAGDGGPTVLVTGATGFIGHQVVHRLRAHPARPRLRLLAHESDPADCCAGPSDVVRGSLTAPGSLRDLCRGVDTVLHLASTITEDPATAHAVNTAGTEALLAEADRSGVRCFVRLSTTAVYGPGPHRGEPRPSGGPLSVTSASRLAGDRSVLAAGGTVLRPGLVYGAGDVWAVPAFVRMIAKLPYWIDGGRARLSLISVDDLARATAALAVRPAPPPASAVLHAAHPRPVAVRDLVTTVCRHLGLPLPREDVPRAQLPARLAGRADPALTARLAQLGADHWYDSAPLWSLTGLEPGPGLTDHFAVYAPWYRDHLRDLLPTTTPPSVPIPTPQPKPSTPST
ncbi:NAD(P)-dependent oxidoreductase [Streptomyces sp. NPDC005921]|uniref:NAD-dependent epimerase/dehydratase family protein n=1 Tax=Streptomyces sp. NPDC005827 TaxID=3157070 RepID=UPI0033FF06C4